MPSVTTTASAVSITAQGSAPAWWTNPAFAAGTWTTVAGSAGQMLTNVIAANNPFPAKNYGVAAGYCGGGVDQARRAYMLIANGGHSDGADNSGFELRLGDAVPAWRRISDPTPLGSTGDLSLENGGKFTDGRPRAMHSTNEVYGDGRMWFPMMNSVTSNQGGHADWVLSYDRDGLGQAVGSTSTSPIAAGQPGAYTTANIGQWTFHGPHNGNTQTFGFGVGLFDRVNHRIYGLANQLGTGILWWRFDSQGPNIGVSQAWVLGSPHIKPAWGACAYDLGIMILGSHESTNVFVLNLATNTWSTHTPSNSGTNAAGSGAVYCVTNRTIGIGNPLTSNGTIYRLSIPVTGNAFNPSGTFSWMTINPGGTPPTFPASFHNNDPPGKNAYSKWNIVENMGDGQSAIVYTPSISNPTYVYKIPSGGLGA